MVKIRNSTGENLFEQVRSLLIESRKKVVRTVNSTMVSTYYEIGRMIVEDEQEGKEKAGYGEETLKGLSRQLTGEFGKGFSLTNLKTMRKFFIVFSKSQTLSGQSTALAKSFALSWSHYVFLLRLEESERRFYEIESKQNNWSVRELERQFNSGLFQRLCLSKDQDEIKKLSEKGQIIETPEDLIMVTLYLRVFR